LTDEQRSGFINSDSSFQSPKHAKDHDHNIKFQEDVKCGITTALHSNNHVSDKDSELAKDGLNNDEDGGRNQGMNAWIEE
jgi:hypothetical protein